MFFFLKRRLFVFLFKFIFKSYYLYRFKIFKYNLVSTIIKMEFKSQTDEGKIFYFASKLFKQIYSIVELNQS